MALKVPVRHLLARTGDAWSVLTDLRDGERGLGVGRTGRTSFFNVDVQLRIITRFSPTKVKYF